MFSIIEVAIDATPGAQQRTIVQLVATAAVVKCEFVSGIVYLIAVLQFVPVQPAQEINVQYVNNFLVAVASVTELSRHDIIHCERNWVSIKFDVVVHSLFKFQQHFIANVAKGLGKAAIMPNDTQFSTIASFSLCNFWQPGWVQAQLGGSVGHKATICGCVFLQSKHIAQRKIGQHSDSRTVCGYHVVTVACQQHIVQVNIHAKIVG